MTPASRLLGAWDTPAIRGRLLPLVPDRVPVRPLAHPWVPIPRWVVAITMPWGIYVREELLGGDADRLARLLVHELVHARQWKTYGPLGFLWRYVGDYLRGRLRRLGHREAYRRIRLEEEAREIAALS